MFRPTVEATTAGPNRYLTPSPIANGPSFPQEEEFARTVSGQPSLYLTIAFPNYRPQYPEYHD
jgi:hypothetical protein